MRKIATLIFVLTAYFCSADIVPVWDSTLGGAVVTHPVSEDGVVYVAAEDRNLYAITTNGELLWKFNVREWIRDSLTVGPDGTVYICTGFGNCLAVNKAGKQIWKTKLSGEPAGSPAIDFRGNIYIPTTTGQIINLSHTGRTKWILDINAPAAAAATLDSDGTLYVPGSDDRVYAVDRYGMVQWMFLCAGVPLQVIPAAENLLVTGTDSGTVVAFTKSGEFSWNYKADAPIAALLADNKSLFACSESGTVFRLDFQGNPVWSVSINERPSGGMLLTDTLNVFTTKGSYYRITLDGAIMDKAIVNGSFTGAHLTTDGMLAAGTDKWKLYAFNGDAPNESFWFQVNKDFYHSSNLQGYNPERVYPDIPDKFNTFALRSLAAMQSEEIRMSVLDEIQSDYETGEYYGKEDLYNELLLFLLEDGIFREIKIDGRIMNDFPAVRSRAADMLAVYGNLTSIQSLRDALLRERDETVIRSILYALGKLGSDGSDRTMAYFEQILNRLDQYVLPEKVCVSMIQSIAGITAYSANYKSASNILIRLYMSNFSATIREDALQVLESIRK